MGGGASALPAHIDKQTFRELAGGTINDAIFDSNSDNGVMTRERLLELALMRDCYLSHEDGQDAEGRDIRSRVARINQALKGRGLLTWWEDRSAVGKDTVQAVATGIDKSRSFVALLTTGYMMRAIKNDPSDASAMSFNYTLRRKHPHQMIPVVFERQMANKNVWKGSVAMALAPLECVDFSDDDNFDTKIDHLYRMITKVSKAGENLFAPEPIQSKSILSQTNKNKEEQQFFQWLARNTEIEENRRIIYCASFVKCGISNVFVLAKMMQENPTFLTSIGVTERDADQIALAVRDLGLGYVPVRNFDHASTVESVVFAMQKSAKASDDPAMAENALQCVVKVASSHPIMPAILDEAGICDAVLKLLTRNLGHAPCQEYGSVAVHLMAVNNPEICAKFGHLTACDVLPRTLRSHYANPKVAAPCATAIATLAALHDNRVGFSNTGACDALVKTMAHCMGSTEVLENCLLACNRLCINRLENVGRLGVGGVCDVLRTILGTHPTHNGVIRHAMELISRVSVEPANRVPLGQAATTNVLVQAMKAQMSDSETMIYSCDSICRIISGNAFNRTNFGNSGACEATMEALQRYYQQPQPLRAACSAIFALAAGNLQHKQRYAPIAGLVQQLSAAPNLPEEVRKEVKEAALRVC